MLVCGREEPIRPNGHIYQGTERVDRLVLSDIDDDRLNRYSFVWLSSWDDASEKLTLLLKVVLSAWDAGGSWLAAYDTGGQVATRSRLHLAKRKKEGWDTWDDGTLAIAVRSMDHIEEDAIIDAGRLSPRHEFKYPGLLWDDPVLIIGRAFSASSMASAATRAALAHLATRSMAPTRKFLGWLARTKRTLIYTAKSHANHPGIIVVGTRRINVEEIVSTGLVSSIEDGDNADGVWWHAPYWPEPTKDL